MVGKKAIKTAKKKQQFYINALMPPELLFSVFAGWVKWPRNVVLYLSILTVYLIFSSYFFCMTSDVECYGIVREKGTLLTSPYGW